MTAATRTEAAKIGGVGLQIVRDWVLRFNAHGPDGLLDRKPPGQPSKLNDGQRQAVVQMIESGPIPAVHGLVRWRLIDLAQADRIECLLRVVCHRYRRSKLRRANCTRDGGGPFGVGNQVPISSHCKLPLSKAMVASVADAGT